MAACSWYGPSGLLASDAVTRAIPSAMAGRSQRVRSCSASGTSAPSGPVRDGTSCVDEQHEREQAGDLAVVGDEAEEVAGQADGLRGEVGSHEVGPGHRGVALVEQQVQHLQHDAEPVGALRVGWQPERGAAVPDPLLGPADALRHRRFGHEVGASDLGGGETGHRAQREGSLSRWRQRRMAAEEQQRQGVVARRCRVRRRRREAERLGLLPAPAGVVAAQAVGEAASGDRQQPGFGAGRAPLDRPLDRCRDECLLDRVLALVEVPVPPHEGAEDLRGEAPGVLHVLGRRGHISRLASFINGRISTPT